MSESYAPVGEVEEVLSTSLSTLDTSENQYKFVTNTYEGSGGYKDGSYLVIFDKESDLNRRKKLVYFKNYVKGIVDSLLVPVFSEDAVRSSSNDMFNKFAGNVDLKGTKLQDFTDTVTKYARMHGVCFTVIDNFDADEIPETRSEAINSRKLPYMYFYTADEVGTYETDEDGVLEKISFKDGTVMGDGGKQVPSYRLWTPEYSVRYFVKPDGKMKVIGDKIMHGLGFLPVIATYSRMVDDVLPEPPIYDLCRMNYTVFNMDSEQRNLERLCAFPMLTMQTKDSDVNINVGADSLITYGGEYDGSVTAPTWIAPPVEILKVLNELSNELVLKIVESANLLGASAVSTGASAKSGVALSYEFLGQQYALKHTARIAENFETMVAAMFGMFIGEAVEYSVAYSDNYAPSQDDLLKKIEVLEKLIALNLAEDVINPLKDELAIAIKQFYGIKDE